MGESRWTWATASPRERAAMVRGHARGSRPLSFDQLCELFDLTKNGLDAILAGNDWRPEYERPAINYV